MIRDKIREIGEDAGEFEWHVTCVVVATGFIEKWQALRGNLIIDRIEEMSRTFLYIDKTRKENKIPISKEEEEYLTEIFCKAFYSYVEEEHKKKRDEYKKLSEEKNQLLDSINFNKE